MTSVCNQYASYKVALCAVCEAVLVALAPLCAAKICLWYSPELFESYLSRPECLLQACVFAMVFVASFYWNGLYDLRKPLPLTHTLALTQAVGIACIILGISYALLPALAITPTIFFVALAVVLLSLVCTRILGAAIWRMAVPVENTIILGTHSLAVEIAQALDERRDIATKLVGFVATGRGDHATTLLGYPVLGTMDDLEHIVGSRQISRIVVAIEERRGVLPIRKLVRFRVEGIRVEEAQSVIAALTGHVRLEALQPSWLVFSDGFRRSRLTLLTKRVADLVLSISGFLVSLPVMAITAAAIRLDSRGPILYRQQRVGYQGRYFDVLKFRSMRVDAEINGAQWASADDARVTRVGRFIRRFRLDELPQFINVIRGEMSFVGPRPERPVFVEQLRERTAYYDQRHSVLPGITGWAQVQYRYGASIEDACVKLEYDLFYLQKMSMLFDLLIVFKTFRTVLLTGERGDPVTATVPTAPRMPTTRAPSTQVKSASFGS
jgi:sugar transferase (PEP-CTERM system associated)